MIQKIKKLLKLYNEITRLDGAIDGLIKSQLILSRKLDELDEVCQELLGRVLAARIEQVYIQRLENEVELFNERLSQVEDKEGISKDTASFIS